MADQATQRLDRWTLTGIAACGLPVAAFSTYSQFETAVSAGVPHQLAWVLPMATDATAFVATRAWLIAPRSSGLRRYAASLALGCMGLSFAGAAVHLVIHDSPWWMRLVVGGLPSLALAALVHLAALLAGARTAETPTAQTTRAKRRKTATPENHGIAPVAPDTEAEPSPATDAPSETPIHLERPPHVPSELGASVVTLNTEKGALRQQMLKHLDAHPDTTGAALDQLFGTTDYGRGVRRTWLKHREDRARASGE